MNAGPPVPLHNNPPNLLREWCPRNHSRNSRVPAGELLRHLSTADFRVGVPALAGPDRLKAVLQPPDRALTTH